MFVQVKVVLRVALAKFQDLWHVRIGEAPGGARAAGEVFVFLMHSGTSLVCAPAKDILN